MTQLYTYSIGELCKLEKGNSPTMKTPAGDYPLVVTAEFRRTADAYQFDTEAVCVPLVSSTGHGNAALHRVHYESGKFALANILVALIPKDTSLCNAKYLYFLLQAQKDYLLVPLMQGTANVSLKVQDIAGVKLSLPPIDEQRRIVTKIESLAAKIDEIRQLRRAIHTDAQAVLLSAFQQVIEGAEYRPMCQVAPIVRRNVEIEVDGEYPELGVRSFGKGVFHKPTLTGIDLPDWQKFYRIHEGDLIFNLRKAWEGSIGVAAVGDHNRVGSHNSYITCVPKEGVATSEFLSFYFLSPKGLAQVQEGTRGSADRNRVISIGRLNQFNVPIPDYNVQLWFNRLQARVADIAQSQADNQTELDALLPATLDRAFKGEL